MLLKQSSNTAPGMAWVVNEGRKKMILNKCWKEQVFRPQFFSCSAKQNVNRLWWGEVQVTIGRSHIFIQIN